MVDGVGDEAQRQQGEVLERPSHGQRSAVHGAQSEALDKRDDAQAKARVSAFIKSLGLRPMDTGQLPMARTPEHLALLSLGLVAHSVENTNFSLGVSLLGCAHP